MSMGDAVGAAAETGGRVLDGVISRHEKPVLAWLAERVPSKVAPDHLTLLGVFGAVMVAVSLSASHWSPACLWLALCGLVVNWLGDSLDGTLARLRRIERPRYGFFVDHMSDIASQGLIVLGLGLSPFMRFDIVCLGLIAYLILSIYTFIKLHVSRTMQLTYFGVGPTEVRAVIGFGIGLAATISPPVMQTPIGLISLFDAAALVIVVFALVSAAVMFSKDLSVLAALDPPRHGVPDEVRMVDLSHTRHSTRSVSQ